MDSYVIIKKKTGIRRLRIYTDIYLIALHPMMTVMSLFTPCPRSILSGRISFRHCSLSMILLCLLRHQITY